MAKKNDAYYFNNFTECAEYSVNASKLLGKIMENYDQSKLQEYKDEMHKIEHSADMKKHELTEALVKAFITPIDREDIVEVSQNLDELTDKIEDVLIRIYCNRVSEIREDAKAMVEIVIKSCDEVLALMREFGDFKHSKKIKQTLGIEFKYHYLRHTYGTRLAEQNMPSHLLCNQMGHASSKVTEKYYIAVSKHGMEIIKDKIEGI